ncbi:MAG: SHOCT domain-containing protein [Actinomycetota bacterium]
MGLFKKNPEESAERRAEWSRKKHEKAREKLTKLGHNLEGCLLLDDSYDDGAYEYLLIFPDRIEYINTGQITSLLKRGRGVEVIPVSKISSVSTSRKLIFEIVQITTSGQVIEFKSDPYHAALLKAKILELMNGPQTSVQPSVADPTEQIAKLAELHRAGALTDEEFAEKKTELLRKI